MGRRRFPGRALTLLAVVAAIAVWMGTHQTRDSHSPAAAPAASPSQPAGPVAPSGSESPGRFAARVIAHADEAGVSPQLLMAILYNESYKPHDPGLERAWQRLTPDAAFGIANMHKSTFDEVKHGRAFTGRDWQELPDDTDLAIQAAAWQLHDLAADLPSKWTGHFTKEELVALGYNAGARNMLAFARGVSPGPAAASYVDRLSRNWGPAQEDIQHAQVSAPR